MLLAYFISLIIEYIVSLDRINLYILWWAGLTMIPIIELELNNEIE